MGIEREVVAIRKRRKKERGFVVPDRLQGVSKARVREFLSLVGLGDKMNVVDAVYALLDDETESWFRNAPEGSTLASGAANRHIGCHVAILQRGKSTRLDREGRDYWLKPLTDIGAIEEVILSKGRFVPGHLIAKSSNSSYRLANGFLHVLQAPDREWKSLAERWLKEETMRERLAVRREVEAVEKAAHTSKHAELIAQSVEVYAKRFLKDYEVIYVDDGDRDRITEDAGQRLERAGIELRLDDASPDVLLWNSRTDRLWVIEAVTSDGEVDEKKVEAVTRLVKRHHKAGVSFTTTYRSWKDAAKRQGAHRNIAVGTYIWIADDPGRALWVMSFNPPQAIESLPPDDRSLSE